MDNKTLINLDNDLMLKSENIEYNNDTLKNVLDNRYNFSTEEQIVGKWLDNKPIYRKVYSIKSVATGLSQNFNVSALNISELLKLEGIVTYQEHYNGDLIKKTTTYYDFTNKKITVYIPIGENAIASGILIIYYIKTTD